ncbi:34413_t:CDS:1, partial [Gigaspora margarita]
MIKDLKDIASDKQYITLNDIELENFKLYHITTSKINPYCIYESVIIYMKIVFRKIIELNSAVKNTVRE